MGIMTILHLYLFAMFNAICFISIFQYCYHCDLYNILVYTVTFIDYGFCIVTFVAKLFTEGHSFDCIRPMLNFLMLRYLLHREQC